MSNRTYPTFDELPFAEGTDMKHAWSAFGPGDVRGTLNFLTDERRLSALASPRTGQSIGLSLPLDQPDFAPFSRTRLTHELYPANGFSWCDRLDDFDTQSSSQWDGLLHVSHAVLGFYGGRRGDPRDHPDLGIDAWARVGIIGRGVLIDVATHLGITDALDGRVVTSGMIGQMLCAQGTTLLPGDILCLRFGWIKSYLELDAASRESLMERPTCAGLSADAGTAEFLWNHQVAALVSDNPTVEVQPGDRSQGFLHHRLITMLGMPIGELFDLDHLADACRETGSWEFLFTSVPLNLPGGAASPANTIAII